MKFTINLIFEIFTFFQKAALHIAVEKGNLEIVDALLSQKLNVNIKTILK